MKKDYSTRNFLQSLCKHMSFSEIKIRKYLARITHISLFILLLAVPQIAKADTTFSPTNTDHFNVSLLAGNDGYNLMKFRTLTYDFKGREDRMDNFTVYFSTNNGVSYTKIAYFKIGNNNALAAWIPEGSASAGYFSTSVANYSYPTSGDRRYFEYTWKFPQSLAGQNIRFKISYNWDLDWYFGSHKQTIGTYEDIYLTPPSYSPVITSSAFVPKPGNNVAFTYTKSASSSPVNKVYIYSDASCSNLLSSFDVGINETAVSKTFAWSNTFVGASSLYVKYNYVITDAFNAASPNKNYSLQQTVTNNGYIAPSNIKSVYDNCSKAATISWDVNTNGGLYSKVGKWVVERKLSSQADNLYQIIARVESALTVYVDETIAYDQEYNYRLRFVPAEMDETRVLSEFSASASVSTKRIVLNTLSFETFTKTSAENPKIKINWTPNWCYNELIKIQRKNMVTNAIVDINVRSTSNNNTKTITDENLTENLKYQYRLVVETEGRVVETAWQNTMIKDEVKYKSVTSSKGTLADRIQLKWNVERNDLSNSFFIKRQLLEEGKENPNVDVTNITTNGKYYSYDDRDISPGVLYKYTLGSVFTLQSGEIDTVYYNSDIIGYAQASGTISGRITFGSGTSVDSVSVFANNANESQSLYRAISFNGGGGYGQVALKPEKHGCVKDGFTWQGWLRPLDANKDMAIYECLKEYSIWYEGSVLNVYLDQISDFDSQISYDMSSIPANEYFHASVSFDGDATLKLYINAKEVASTTLSASDKLLTDKCQNTVALKDTTIAYLGDGFLVKGSFKGNVDDLRLWDYALTAKEINDNYNRYINGSETGLVGYWQFDEGLSKYAFDRSNYKKIYNEHHITFTQAESTTNVPTLDQLSIKGVTDKNGNYLISGIPFTGDGSTYAFTPSKQSHEFEPSQLNRHLTFQSSVHNAVDFKDISSFKVRIKTTYDNTSFPVDSVDVLVDGAYIYKDKKILSTDTNGECIIDVPIGTHTITVDRRGHTFVDGSKSGTAITMNFVEPILGEPIKFYDTTKTILAGRVVGGVAQGSKPLGFGLSKANIGEAKITIEVPDGDYQLNLGDTIATVAGSINNTINSVAKIAAKSKIIKVTTDSLTGEFRVMLPPLKYKITDITTRGGLTGQNFNLPEFKLDPNIILSDTTVINKEKTIFKYNQKLNFTYRVDKISIDVIDPTMPSGVFGDSVFMYTNLTNNTKVRVPMYTMLNNNPLTPTLDANGKPTYKYGLPIYQTTNIYKLRVFAYEQYTHPDNSKEMEEFCRVPASNAKINIQNELGRYELPLGSTGDPNSEDAEVVENAYVFDNDGIFDYTFKAGFPNLVSPYTLGLKIEVDYKDKKSSWEGNDTFKAIVMGDILTGTDFVTSGPDLISFVLRDPPGSNSYSYMEKGTTISNSYSFSKSYVGSESLMGTINYGQKISVAYGSLFVLKLDEIDIENKTGAGVEIEQSAGKGSEFNISTTTTERIETSSSSDYVGRRGDIYVGTSTNLFFGTSKRLNPVLVGSDYQLQVKDEKVGNLTANTNFKYTYAHITETLIPSITKLRNDLIETVDNTSTASAYIDKVRYVSTLKNTDVNFGKEGTYKMIEPTTKTAKQYDNEVLSYNTSINGWIAQLAKEEDDKVLAMESREGEIYTKTNESSDAGVTSEKSITVCGSSNKTSTSSFSRQGVFKTENGLAYNNTGFQFEFETKHGAESESVSGSGKEYCTTYGYVFSDENAGDYLSVDVYTPVVKQYDVEDDLTSETKVKNAFDSYSGAPIFITRGGRTSCPFEPQEVAEYSTKNLGKALGVATLQVEKPLLQVANPFATEIPSGKEASYKITLSNLSESNSAGWYLLTVDEKTNSKGAIITVDGQTLGNGKLYYVVPNEPMEKVLKLKQSSLDELEYENINLLLSSTCDDLSSAISISAQFVPSCSDVTLEITNKIVNTTTSDVLPIKIKDYNRDYKNFGGIILKYKTINQDETAWSTIRQFVNDPTILPMDQNSEIITASSINYLYSMTGKADQTYQFKAVTVCAFGTGLVENESEVINVVKDMVTPTSLGTPSPSNGILTPESEISITFNEDIQNGLLNSTNFKAEAVMNGYTLKHNVGLDFAGASEAYSEQQFNLQSVPVSVEAWIRYSQSNANSNATLFSIGEGSNQLKLQLNGNTLKAIAGTQEFTGNIVADENWQYISLGYNPESSKITVNVTGQMNNNVKVIDQTVTTAIEPSGRFSVGKTFKGNMSELSLWIKDRDLAAMAVDRNTSKSGRETGIIAYWPMSEAYGTLAADKVNSRNLTVNGGWYLERMGKAIVLNGSSQNILISTATIPVKPTEDFSIEFWFKSGVQTNKTMFSCGKGLGDLDASSKLSVGFDANSKLTVYSNGNTHLIPSTEVQDNQWHHFALSVLRTGNANVLIDGVVKYQIAATKFGALGADKMSIGARYFKTNNVDATDQYFAGALDELRIWKGALTAENIRLDMHNKLLGSETGLLAYYPFEAYTVNNASQLVISESLKDAIIPTTGAVSGGTAENKGIVTFTASTPAMKEARPKENVYFNWTSTSNKIVFNVLETLSRIENCTLEFTVDRVLDLNGNRMSEPKKWTVYVDNNRLKWASDAQSLKKEVLAPMSFTTSIVNNSGKYENYVIDGLPSWLSVDKSSGQLNPLAKTELTFTVDDATNIGSYESRIILTGNNNIQEMLPVALKVTGPRPDWSVNPHDFNNSMSITGQVKIDNIYQEDTEDMLAAFIGTRCVGIANPVFNKTLNSYIVFLDVYGLDTDENQAVKFSLWDAGTGRVYPDIDVTTGAINFVANAMLGTVSSTKIFNATDKIEQQLTLKQGWNWFSTNVISASPALLSQFKTSIDAAGIQIKSRNDEYISYSNNAWVGTLAALNQTSMYMVKTNVDKTVKLVGSMAKSADLTNSIVLNPQWNWIGYIPQFVAPVKEALSNLTAKDGDQIKGQVGFATYTNNAWYGSLQYLNPGMGYKYYSNNTVNSSFNYPSLYLGQSKIAKQNQTANDMKWSVNVAKYQMSMTVTAVAELNGSEIPNESLQVAVFVGDECRGTVSLKYVESLNKHIAFLMVWGNVEDISKKISFKAFDPLTNSEMPSNDLSLSFVPDNITGSPDSPFKISFISAGINTLNNNRLSLYPNPATDILHLNYEAAKVGQIEVYDNMGRKLSNYVEMSKTSINIGSLIPGVYTLKVTLDGIQTNHMFIKK